MDTRDLPSTAPSPATAFSVAEAKRLVADLFERRPLVYWLDFLASVAVAWGVGAVYLLAPAFSAVQVIAFLVAGIAVFRAATFVHEIAHMPRGTMRGFRLVWNLLCGVPVLMPSPMYDSHADHHSGPRYGTPADGEYLPLGAGPTREILRFLATLPIVPLIGVFRFLVLGPVSFLHPGLRRWVLERASSLVVSPYYRREAPPRHERWRWALMDLACFVYLATVLALTIAGVIPITGVLMVYLLITYAIGLNWVRTLAAHHYRNPGGRLSHLEQMLDSINVVGYPWLMELLFPVGLRFHALHHLFPALPYHALGTAHRRLAAGLPADSPYHLTACPSLWAALARLWRDARASEGAGLEPMARWREA